jgi:hypothetical protein
MLRMHMLRVGYASVNGTIEKKANKSLLILAEALLWTLVIENKAGLHS